MKVKAEVKMKVEVKVKVTGGDIKSQLIFSSDWMSLPFWAIIKKRAFIRGFDRDLPRDQKWTRNDSCYKGF